VTKSVSELALDDDLEDMAAAADSGRWSVVRAGPLEIWCTLSPTSLPDQRFQARLLWTTYPDCASLKFRDPSTGRLDRPEAWPKVRGFRPASVDACVNYCAEGFALHPEWRADPRLRWNSGGNAVLRTIRTLQNELDYHFQGRHP
jgi:hypothetical protein